MLHKIFIIIWSFNASPGNESLLRITTWFSNDLSMISFAQAQSNLCRRQSGSPVRKKRQKTDHVRKENLNLSIDIWCKEVAQYVDHRRICDMYAWCSEHIALRPAFPLFVQTSRYPAFLFLAAERVLPLKGSHSAINTCRQTIHFTSFPFIMKIAQNACAACVI